MKVTITLLLLGSVLAVLSSCVSAPGYEGERGEFFDGRVFSNRTPMDKNPADFLRLSWGFMTQSEAWPKWLDTPVSQVPNERVTDGISVTFINHSTILLQVDGLNILTDPIYAERASPFSFAGPRRVHAPGVKIEDLPDIDIVLISHNHYDHLDAATLQALHQRQAQPPMILAGLGNGGLFDELGLDRYKELAWNESFEMDGQRFVFSECRHRSGRGLTDQMKTLWGSFVIEAPSGNVYFAGDTGYDRHFRDAAETFGEFALAILPIGAYEPRWFMADVHLDPLEAVIAHKDLNSRQSLGMHYGTFQLTYEAVDQPERDLAIALREQGVSPNDFWTLSVGETRRLK